MGIIVIIIGLAMFIAGFTGILPGLSGYILSGTGFLVVLIRMLALLMSFYRRTGANQAFVRTGMGGSHVVINGGATVLPFVHRVIEIDLKTMKLGVNPRGHNALISRDKLRASVLAQFYIRVQADSEHILSAVRSIGESNVDVDAVRALVSEKLVSGMRTIASQMDLFEIHTKRDEFAERVKEYVESDLEANGLLLVEVTVSQLDQSGLWPISS